MFKIDQESPVNQVNFNKKNCTSSPKISLSILTLPCLIGIATFNQIQDNLIELGKMSEEIFRGDRLPILSSDNTSVSNQEVS